MTKPSRQKQIEFQLLLKPFIITKINIKWFLGLWPKTERVPFAHFQVHGLGQQTLSNNIQYRFTHALHHRSLSLRSENCAKRQYKILVKYLAHFKRAKEPKDVPIIGSLHEKVRCAIPRNATVKNNFIPYQQYIMSTRLLL